MTDASLVSAFEAGTLAPADFHHREHVRLAWLYLQRYGPAETERRLLHGLRALAVRAGKPDKFDEPLTRAWLRRIDQAAASGAAAPTSEAFLAMHPELLGRLPEAPSADAIIPADAMALRLIPHLHRATHRIGLHIAELEDPVVNQAEAHVLAHLATAGEATIGQVHRAFGHRRSTLTSILDRLEERHWIARTSDARDRRTFVISLTRAGRFAARRVVEHLEVFEKRALQSVAPADVRAFLRVLARFEADEE